MGSGSELMLQMGSGLLSSSAVHWLKWGDESEPERGSRRMQPRGSEQVWIPLWIPLWLPLWDESLSRAYLQQVRSLRRPKVLGGETRRMKISNERRRGSSMLERGKRPKRLLQGLQGSRAFPCGGSRKFSFVVKVVWPGSP